MTPHASLMTPQASLMTPQASLMTPQASLMTPQASLMTPQASLMTPQASLASDIRNIGLVQRRSSAATAPGGDRFGMDVAIVGRTYNGADGFHEQILDPYRPVCG